MVSIRYRNDGNTHHLHITGHAGYAPAGSDIVCAGVSAIAFALSGYLAEAEGETGSGALKLRCPKGTNADCAFQMALAGFHQIAKTYPQYVEVDITPSGKGEEKEYEAYVQHQHNRDCL